MNKRDNPHAKSTACVKFASNIRERRLTIGAMLLALRTDVIDSFTREFREMP